MTSANKRLIVFLTCLALATSAFAQSSREQLQQLTIQLQQTPNDNILRERIIKLGTEIKPAPAIPEEAKRRMARGTAAFKSATSATGYQDAAKEYEQATLAAPWYGDAYYNLGVSQDKAGNFKAALRSLKLALLTSPDSEEMKALIYEVEYRDEKANSPEAQATREKEAEQRFIDSLEGAKYVCPEFRNKRDARRVEIDIKNGEITGAIVITWLNPDKEHPQDAYVGFRGYWSEPIPLRGRVNQGKETRVELYEDRLVSQTVITHQGGRDVFPAKTCLRTNKTR